MSSIRDFHRRFESETFERVVSLLYLERCKTKRLEARVAELEAQMRATVSTAEWRALERLEARHLERRRRVAEVLEDVKE